MSPLEAIRWHHCCGLIHKFGCIIIINAYNSMYVLVKKLSVYTIYTQKIKSKTIDEKLSKEVVISVYFVCNMFQCKINFEKFL